MHSRVARRAEHAIGALQKFWLSQATVFTNTISLDRKYQGPEGADSVYLSQIDILLYSHGPSEVQCVVRWPR